MNRRGFFKAICGTFLKIASIVFLTKAGLNIDSQVSVQQGRIEDVRLYDRELGLSYIRWLYVDGLISNTIDC